MGRPRKTHAELTASGSWRASTRAEPLRLPTSRPDTPKGLGPLAAEAWEAICTGLGDTLARVDGFALESLCRAIQESHDLTAAAAGFEVGTHKWSAIIAARNKACGQIEKGCRQFGLDPYSRDRMPRTPAAAPHDDRKRSLLKPVRNFKLDPSA